MLAEQAVYTRFQKQVQDGRIRMVKEGQRRIRAVHHIQVPDHMAMVVHIQMAQHDADEFLDLYCSHDLVLWASLELYVFLRRYYFQSHYCEQDLVLGS
jgi:hypothetical protein